MKCYGIDPSSGRNIALFFERSIQIVDDLLHPPGDLPLLAPAWIDLQVNGFAGVDYNSPATPAEEIAKSLHAQFATGVARIFPTVITGPPDRMLGSIANLAKAKESLAEGEAIEGIHVEGPHISPEDGPRGAHPKDSVRPPDVEEYRRWQDAANGNVRIVTLSPEWPEACRYIEALVADGVVVSIGHTKADTEQIDAAVSAGASMSTHLGNGAHSTIQRHPNYIWDQLADDRLSAGFIVDGIHLPASFFKTAVRAKGPERSILVTDAVMPAGCEPGPFRLGTVDVELHPGDRVTMRGQERLAGSALRLDRAIENAVRFAGVSLTAAIAMATRNPARAARVTGRQKGFAPGERADLVEFAWDPEELRLTVGKTYLGGQLVYS